MHKMAFSGIPGSGKTSILAEVKKLLALKYRVEEVPDLRTNGPFDFDQKACFISQFYFITSQINEENIRSQSHPDFLLCDSALLDHWLDWQRSLAAKPANGPTAEKKALLDGLYRFWIPTYSLVFRIRVDANELKKRLATAKLHEYPLDRAQQLDELYGQIIQRDRIPAVDVWNQQTIDECAQQVMTHVTDMKWI